MKVLVDTNVIMDALIGRQPYFDDVNKIIKMCADKKPQEYLAAHSNGVNWNLKHVNLYKD